MGRRPRPTERVRATRRTPRPGEDRHPALGVRHAEGSSLVRARDVPVTRAPAGHRGRVAGTIRGGVLRAQARARRRAVLSQHPIQELIERRDLLMIMAWRVIKVKYKQSVMGMLWAVLMPIVIVCSGFIVRIALSSVSGKPVAMADLTAVAVKA